MTGAVGRWLAAAAASYLLAAGLSAQGPPPPARQPGPLRVSSAVAPETVTVGDRFRSVVQLVVPDGASVEFRPLPLGDSLQPVDSVRVIPGRAGEPPVAAYSLVAWVAGSPLSAQAAVRVVQADGSAATYLVPLRLPVVRSVLPADTAGVRPRPARGPIAVAEPGRSPWPWIALAGLLLAGAAATWLRWRRRDGPQAGGGTPRERAMAALDRLARESDGAGGADALYTAGTRVLRDYLAESGPSWSGDLTTRELLETFQRDGLAPEPRESLARLLHHADRVKFGRYAPTAEEMKGFLAASRTWVAAYPASDAAPQDRREAA